MNPKFRNYVTTSSNTIDAYETWVYAIIKFVNCARRDVGSSHLGAYSQVPTARRASWKTLGLFTYRWLLLTVWTVLALPGVLLNSPIFITAKLMSRKKAKGTRLPWPVLLSDLKTDPVLAEALAASTVKVAARDVIGTWKVLISLGLAPVLYGFYAFLATLIMIKADAPFAWKVWTPFAVTASLPLIGFAALKFGEAGMDVLKYA